MGKSKQSNLTLSTVKKVSKQLDETRVHIIEKGAYVGEQITFNPLFNDQSIEELLTELGQYLNEAESKEVEIDQKTQLNLIYMLTIKYFTHFKKDLPSTLFTKDKKIGMIEMLKHFNKTGLIDECINRIFLPQEINKVLSKVTDFAALGLLSEDLEQQMQDKLNSLKAKNKFIYDQLEELNIENEVVE